MGKLFFNLMIVGPLLAGVNVGAKPLTAEIVMQGGRSWKGQIVGRDGDWLEFLTGTSDKPIRVGASTLQGLNFTINIDGEKVSDMMRARDFEGVISVISNELVPYAEYGDIPSNLTKYNALLFELYYRTRQYEKSLDISSAIAKDDRDPALREKSRIYQILALIELGRSTDAEALMAQYGWKPDSSEDTSPEKLYIMAKLLVLKKDYNQAMERVAKVVAFHSGDTDWMQPAELLCAEIYTQMGMYDSADSVISQIMMLYKDTPEYDKAAQLKIQIEKLRAEKKLEENLESKEA
ncbi:MAG: tetratricopeptide repeat protein [Kiritimatiellales bacterium]|nr:tetratricopeptide repeat protein [Kiritimatiellales bacterium]